MKYKFNVTFSTDGDFGFDYVPMGMKFDECDDIVLEKEFTDREKAIKYIEDTCGYLKRHIRGRDYVIEDVKNMLSNFCKDIRKNPDKKFYQYEIGGNYEGTEITFEEIPNRYTFTFGFTDEEDKIFREVASKKLIDNKYLKNLILNECKKVLEEHKYGIN